MRLRDYGGGKKLDATYKMWPQVTIIGVCA